MGEASILDGGQQVSWRAWFHEHEALFDAFVVLDPDGNEINHDDAKSIIWKALEDAARRNIGKPLDANAVLQAGDHRAAAFFRKPLCNYALVTTLSVRNFPAKRIRVKDCIIMPISSRGKRYPLPKILSDESHGRHFSQHLANTKYSHVRIVCKGRTRSEAVREALESLNLLRAIWSFGITRGRWSMRLGSGPRRPIGVIHTGPVHTLHHPDGTAAHDELYWYDPDYTRDLDLFDGGAKWEKLESDRRWAMRRLAMSPYRKDLEEVFLRYVSALDQLNPNVAFLQLWGVLEKITNTLNAKYDETIDRACWVFSKTCRREMKETLQTLRHHRNRHVHAGTAREDEGVAYRIKSFVDPHLHKLLNNAFRVSSLQEYGEFLSMSTSAQSLERTKSWSSLALRVTRQDEEHAATAKKQASPGVMTRSSDSP
jgi:hypothetical protein